VLWGGEPTARPASAVAAAAAIRICALGVAVAAHDDQEVTSPHCQGGTSCPAAAVGSLAMATPPP
jgi:hypothetical protein